MADSTATTATPEPVKGPSKIVSGIKSVHRHMFLDINTCKVSFSKLWAELAGLFGILVAFQSQLVSLGIDIPSRFSIYFKIAAIGSAVIAAIRLRNSSSIKEAE
jgi:hypothetical protein